MDELDYWRLCEEFSIDQAALLIVGQDPGHYEGADQWDSNNWPRGYVAARTAICGGLKNYIRYQNKLAEFESQSANMREDHLHAPDMVALNDDHLTDLYNRSIQGTLVQQMDEDMNGNPIGLIEGSVDLTLSIVNADSLKQWLRLKGFTTGFFFPEPVATMDFLDPLNPRYAPKLAASVCAWQSVTNAGKQSPKQALDKWLREHASEFNLTNEEGKPVDQAIGECSKVANWNAKGGATKTPG